MTFDAYMKSNQSLTLHIKTTIKTTTAESAVSAIKESRKNKNYQTQNLSQYFHTHELCNMQLEIKIETQTESDKCNGNKSKFCRHCINANFTYQ